jgi:hypothetical protein
MEASSRGASEGATSTGRGQIGRQTFELAHNLIREGKKPTEAFAIVAENTGRSAATVATAYYRVAQTIPGGAGGYLFLVVTSSCRLATQLLINML